MLSKVNMMTKGRKDTFIMHERFPNYLSPRMKHVYLMSIVKAFSKECGELYFPEGIPVTVQIEIRMVKQSSQAEKEELNLVGFPRIDKVGQIFVEALSGAAFYNANQVSELYITKLKSNEDRIKVQIFRST